MSVLEALILGIVQGLTEFLPVSSSGHLELFKALLGSNMVAKESLLFTVVVHFATALSTVFVYRKDLLDIFKGLFAFKATEQTLFSFKIVLSMIPAAVIGVLFNDEIEHFFEGNIAFVGAMLLLTAVLLLVADRAKNTNKKVGFFEAVIVGIAQSIAILPGISRSGATISTSVLLGIDKEKAARFSFLMVVPLILGKVAKDLLDDGFQNLNIETLPLIIGFISAFVTGVIACTWMIQLVKRSKLSYFAIYCAVVGVVALGVSFI